MLDSLQSVGVPGYLRRIFGSYLSKRGLMYDTSESSETLNITDQLPQYSVLGPCYVEMVVIEWCLDDVTSGANQTVNTIWQGFSCVGTNSYTSQPRRSSLPAGKLGIPSLWRLEIVTFQQGHLLNIWVFRFTLEYDLLKQRVLLRHPQLLCQTWEVLSRDKTSVKRDQFLRSYSNFCPQEKHIHSR